jgi:O-antigen/teichoic acid export membrane protein
LAGVAASIGAGANAMLVAYAVLAPLLGCAIAVALLIRSGIRLRRHDARIVLDESRRRLMLVAALASAAVLNGDVLLLLAVSDQRQVAIYAAAWRIAAGLSIFNAALASALLPYIMTSGSPRRDLDRLARTGLGLTALFLVLLPAIVSLGMLILGKGGHGTGPVLTILVAAFALDTFITFVYQSFIRVGRTALPVANVVIELILMASLTIVLRAQGALAPAYGQLAARVAGVCVFGIPILLERRGKLRWFDPRFGAAG